MKITTRIFTFPSLLLTIFNMAISAGYSMEKIQQRSRSNIPADVHLWLEEVEGEKALQWVQGQNKRILADLEKFPAFKELEGKALEILNSKERIPYGQLRQGHVYNFWQDQQHVKGVWRRAPLQEYKKENPQWEILLDIDELSLKEKESWVFKGAHCLPPEYERCLVSLSRGGKDATEIREFDLMTKSFIPRDRGFFLSESKNVIKWMDKNTVLVGTDFGPGSLTRSGYARLIKLWKRGQTLEEALTLLEGTEEDVSVFAMTHFSPQGNFFVLGRSLDFHHQKFWLLHSTPQSNDQKWGKVTLDLPADAEILGLFDEQLLVRIKSDFLLLDSLETESAGKGADGKKKEKMFPAGSLLTLRINRNDILAMGSPRLLEKADLVFSPQERMTIEDIQTTRSALLVVVLDNVRTKILKLDRTNFAQRKYRFEEIPLPDKGSASLISTNDFHDHIFINYESFLTPPRLFLNDISKAVLGKGKAGTGELVKSLPQQFDGGRFTVQQKEAKSKDGTKIPYFMVYPKDMKWNGQNPTLLYGYGGFEVSLLPNYLPLTGRLWLEQGGVYVQANIRGGGEFGPSWHQAALKENRHKAFEDFIAVALDLIQGKVASPQTLGIMGGSNGGLLVGVSFTQHPELFNAVVCQVPLLDMIRYSKLLAGASWIGEYGDPESEKMRKILLSYSPYHNIKDASEGVKYPEVLFVTSTKDDRVHPGHARKMAFSMLSKGHKVHYYEILQGGHGASTNNLERAKRSALEYSFLIKKLHR